MSARTAPHSRGRVAIEDRPQDRTLRDLLDSTPESAALLKPDGIIIAANAVLARRFRRRLGDMIGSSVFDFMPLEIAASRLRHFRRALSTCRKVRFTDCRDGRNYDNTMRPMLDARGRPYAVAVFAHDVTGEIKAQESLRRSERRYRSLAAKLRRALAARNTAVRRLRSTNRRLYSLAHRDDLTRLPNRRCFMDSLTVELDRTVRYGHDASLVLLDMDQLKKINDTFGHGVGDRALKLLASLLRGGARRSDVVARYSGDEFALLMPNTPLKAARRVMERMLSHARQVLVGRNTQAIALSFSAGLCALPARPATPATLMRRVDRALYRAKKAGKGCVRTE